MPLDPRQQPLTPVQARVLATLMEKARTVPDSYPLTLNGVVTGCNQKSSRDPVLQLTEAEVQEALHALRREGLAVEISGQRATRWEHNFPRGVVRIQEGAWYGPTGPEIGALDTYGDPNTLTLDIGTSSLAQATSANTCLVQIEKFVGTAPAVTSFGGPIEVDPQGREVKA